MGFMDNSILKQKDIPERTFEDPQNVDVPFHEQVMGKCDLCGGNICIGEKYYRYQFNNICDREDCEKELAETLLYGYQKYAY